MTPMTRDTDKLKQEESKELDKAKVALTNCVLLELTDRTGNGSIPQDPLLAEEIEALWARVLKVLIPKTGALIQAARSYPVLEGASGWSVSSAAPGGPSASGSASR